MTQVEFKRELFLSIFKIMGKDMNVSDIIVLVHNISDELDFPEFRQVHRLMDLEEVLSNINIKKE